MSTKQTLLWLGLLSAAFVVNGGLMESNVRHHNQQTRATMSRTRTKTNEGLLGTLQSSILIDNASEGYSRKLDMNKCRHPDTDEIIDLTRKCGKKRGKGMGKKSMKRTKTCSPLTELPTTSPSPTYKAESKTKGDAYGPTPPTYGGKAKSKAKGDGFGPTSPAYAGKGKAKSKAMGDGYGPASPAYGGKAKSKAYGPTSPAYAGKAKSKAKGGEYGPTSPAYGGKAGGNGKGNNYYDDDDDDDDIPVCKPTQVATRSPAPPSSTSNPFYDSPIQSPFTPATPGAPFAPLAPSAPIGPGAPGSPIGPGAPGSPIGPGAPAPFAPGAPGAPNSGGVPAAEYCAIIAAGTTSFAPSKIAFNQELVLFSQGTPDDEKFRRFLQQVVAPRSVGCTVSDDHALAAFSDNRRLTSHVKSLVVGDFDAYDVDIGSNCGEPAPSESDNCVSGKYQITAEAEDDASLEGLSNSFQQKLAETLNNDDIVAALGLTGVGGVEDNGSNGDDGNNDRGSNNISAIQSSEPRKTEIKVGPLIVIIFAGIALLGILFLGAHRRRSKGATKDFRKLEDDDDFDDGTSLLDDKSENRTYFDDEISVASNKDTASTVSYHEEAALDEGEASSIRTPASRSVRKLAHVVGEADSTYTGNTWHSRREQQVLSNAMNNNGIAALHPPHETCSSPKCQQCEARRQHSQVKFIKVAYKKKANRMLAERNYVVDDTVVL